jgi:hypothetical protein
MKRSGLLVHAYLIYGFPGQAPSDIVDSAEVVRQLFASGLVDSAFWHRFVLTRHSRMMAQYREGGRPGLKPILDVAAPAQGLFASNDLAFEGESAFDPYDAPLVSALEAWMHGEELERPASSWFPAKAGRKGGVAPGLVESLIARAEAGLDARLPSPGARAAWVAGTPLAGPDGLCWAYRGSLEELRLGQARALRVAGALGELDVPGSGATFDAFLEAAGLGAEEDATRSLLEAGLVLL